MHTFFFFRFALDDLEKEINGIFQVFLNMVPHLGTRTQQEI